MSQERCENCKWWASSRDDNRNCCHRWPPAFHPFLGGKVCPKEKQIMGIFPQTNDKDFCGEFEAKEKPK